MNTKLYLSLLAICLVLTAESSQCEWTAVSRSGGDIRSLAFSGNTLWAAGSKERIYFSTNSGESWTWTSEHHYLGSNTYFKLSFFKEVSLQGYSNGGIYSMWPSGRDWQSSTGNDDILAFAESRGKGAVTFLAGGFGGGIRVTIDSGKTWSPSNTGLANTNVTSLASGLSLPDSNGQVIFAGTYGNGVYASTDNGQNWSPKSQNLAVMQVTSLEVAGEIVYAAGSGGKVCCSTDWGNTWQQVGTGLPNTELLCVATAADSANEWIYCGTIDAGVWRCPAAGGAWASLNTGLENLRINSIVVKSGWLFLGTHQGVYRSLNGGISWTPAGDVGWTLPQLSTLHAIPPSASNGMDLLVAGTEGLYSGGGTAIWSTVFTTADGGANWNGALQGFSGTVVSITHHNELIFLLPGASDASTSLYVSRDMGATWKPTNDPKAYTPFLYCTDLDIVPRQDDSIFDCFISSDWGPFPGIYFSSDTGRSWTQISTKLAKSMGSIDSFLIVSDVFGKAYRTSDYFVTWEDITANLPGNQVRSFADDGDRLLACISYDPANSRPGGLLVTTDGGNSWLPAGLAGKTVTSVLPIGNYLLATANGRVYAAAREGFAWVDVTGNIAGTPAGSLSATSQTCYVLGSDGKSIWKRPMSEIVQTLSSVPASPHLLAPVHGATVQTLSTTLRWTGSPSATHFCLQVSTDSLFAGGFVVDDPSVTDTFAMVSGLRYYQHYFWRVAAVNSWGAGPVSSEWGFTIPANPVRVPTLMFPVAGGVTGFRPMFVWHPIVQALAYHLQVSLDSLFTTSLFSDSAITDTIRQIDLFPRATFYWHVRAKDAAGWAPFSTARSFFADATAVDDNAGIPSTFVLDQNFPNPFNPTTRIRFGLPTASAVNLVVYNILGEEVRTLVNDNLEAGFHVVAFHASELPSGLYLYRMRTGDFVETRKLLLVR